MRVHQTIVSPPKQLMQKGREIATKSMQMPLGGGRSKFSFRPAPVLSFSKANHCAATAFYPFIHRPRALTCLPHLCVDGVCVQEEFSPISLMTPFLEGS